MARRGANEGSIRKRADGRWEACVLVTFPDGRRKRRSYLGRSRAVVREKLREALQAEATGMITDHSLLFGSFLDQWLEDAMRPSVRPSTYRSYKHICRTHLEPGLGEVPPFAISSPNCVLEFQLVLLDQTVSNITLA